MARGRRKKKKKRQARLPDPEAVAAGAADADAGTLLELIRRVNPTDRDLPAEETERRYRLKGQLQSLLVTRHPEELWLEDEPAMPGVVLIGHRSAGGAGSHAVIEALEPEARSWIRRQLDRELGPADPKRPAAVRGRRGLATGSEQARGTGVTDTGPGADPDALLARGRTALEGYDYELAERLLREAVDASGGALAPSLALLELYIDHLAAYGKVAALGEGLPRGTLGDDRVRVLLAVAAAHRGAPDRARQLIGGLESPRAAEIHTQLARNALADGRHEDAARHIDDARRAGGASDLDWLAEQVAASRASLFEADERRVERLLADGSLDRAEEAARELLDRFPHSRVARRVLGKIEGRRRRARLAETLDRAEQALAARDHPAAVQLLREARDIGGGPEVAARLAQVERRLQADLDRREVAAVVAQLGDRDPQPGLTRYLRLGTALRERVRAAAPSAMLDRLEQLGAPPSGGRARRAVAAVLALESAERELASGDAAQALGLLEPHARTLDDVADARRVQQQATRTIEEEEAQRAAQLRRETEQALAAGETGAARRLLTRLQVEVPRREDRDGVARLAAEVTRREQSDRLHLALERQLEQGELLQARDTLDALLARDEQDRAALLQQRADLTRRIQSRWRVELHPAVALPLHPARLADRVVLGLDLAGRRCVLVGTHGNHMFVQFLDVGTGEVTHVGALRTPVAMELVEPTVEDNTLRIVGEQGFILELGLEDLEVRSFRHLGALLHRDAVVDRAYLVPGTRFVWVDSRLGVWGESEEWASSVVDTRRFRIHRELPPFNPVLPVIGAHPPRVLCYRDETGCMVYAPSGASHPASGVPAQLELTSAAVHPDGQGLVLLHSEDDSGRAGPLFVTSVAPDGTKGSPLRLEDSDAEAIQAIATSRREGLSFVLYHDGIRRGSGSLVALRPSGAAMEQVYRVRAAPGTYLAGDAASERVVAVVPDPAGATVRLVPLGASPPACQGGGDRGATRRLPHFDGPGLCRPDLPTAEDRAAVEAWAARLASLSGPAAPGWIEEVREANRDNPDALLQLCQAVRHRPGRKLSHEELVAWAAGLHPDHPGLALAHADELARRSQWSRVCLALEPVVAGEPELDAPTEKHLRHLLGMALLMEDRFKEARETLARGVPLEGECELELYLVLARPFHDPPREEDWGPDQPLVRQIVGATLVADGHLARGEPGAAIEVLQRPAIWSAGELQSLARLAHAHLLAGAEDPSGRLQRTFALASFRGCRTAHLRREVPVPGATWREDRLAQLEQQCRRELAADDDGSR